jgi:P2-related tail formation protein
MDLSNVDFLQLQTVRMRDDKTTQGLCAGLNTVFRQAVADMPKAFGVLMPQMTVEQLSDDIMNQLAYDEHVDWYDPTASYNARLQSIMTARDVYRQLGTPAAVEQAIQPYFDNAYVQEWFDYGYEATPFHYKIFVQGTLTDEEGAKLFKAISKAARLGAVLESVESIASISTTIAVGGAVVHNQTITIGG